MSETASLLDAYAAIDAIKEEADRLRKENAELRAKLDNRKKLTPREVSDLRRLYRNAGLTQSELAEIFDVNPSTISRTVRGIYH